MYLSIYNFNFNVSRLFNGTRNIYKLEYPCGILRFLSEIKLTRLSERSTDTFIDFSRKVGEQSPNESNIEVTGENRRQNKRGGGVTAFCYICFPLYLYMQSLI